MELKSIAEALSKFQGECPVIEKTMTVTVTTKAGFKYSYKYADLPTILSTINPILAKNGLSITQPLSGDTDTLQIKTLLLHTSGENIESLISVKVERTEKMSYVQAVGSAITYLRRYAITSLLNLSADEDVDDAINTDSDVAIKEKPRTPKPEYQKPKPIFTDRDGCISVDQITALNDLLVERRVSPTKFCESYNRRYGTTIGTINEVTPDKFLECIDLLNKK